MNKTVFIFVFTILSYGSDIYSNPDPQRSELGNNQINVEENETSSSKSDLFLEKLNEVLLKVAESQGLTTEQLKVYEVSLTQIIKSLKVSKGDEKSEDVSESIKSARLSGISQSVIDQTIKYTKSVFELKHVTDQVIELTNGRGIKIGIGGYESRIEISNLNTKTHLGVLISGNNYQVLVEYESDDRFFGDITGFGWGYVLSYSELNANYQVIKENYGMDREKYGLDLGTSYNGNIVYFAPRIFYQFGRFSDFKYLLSVGWGIGYTIGEGNIYITDGNGLSNDCKSAVNNIDYSRKSASENQIKGSCELVKIRDSGFSHGISWTMLFEYKNYWFTWGSEVYYYDFPQRSVDEDGKKKITPAITKLGIGYSFFF